MRKFIMFLVLLMVVPAVALVTLGCAGKESKGDETSAKILAAEKRNLELEAELKSTRADFETYREAAGDAKSKPENKMAGPSTDILPADRMAQGYFSGASASMPPSGGMDPCAVGAMGPGIAYVDSFPADDHANREGRQRECGGRCAAVKNDTPDYMALFVNSRMVTICSGGTSIPHRLPVMEQKGGVTVGEYVFVVPPGMMAKMRYDSGMYRITAKFYAMQGAGGALRFEGQKHASFKLPFQPGLTRDRWGLVHTFR